MDLDFLAATYQRSKTGLRLVAASYRHKFTHTHTHTHTHIYIYIYIYCNVFYIPQRYKNPQSTSWFTSATCILAIPKIMKSEVTAIRKIFQQFLEKG